MTLCVPGSSGSLGDLYRGFCRASADAWQPDEGTIAACCNAGYARGKCRRFPEDGGPDAIRFSVRQDDGRAIRVLYAVECDHHPVSSGALDYMIAPGLFAGPPSEEPLARLASAYVRSYLRRTR